MKTFLPLLAALACSIPGAGRAETALSALRALSTGETRSLTEVTGRSESAGPERWFFTVYDAGSPAHQRRLEVARGQVVSSQEVAASAAGEPWDAGEIKVDSDRAGALVLAYAAANHVKFAVVDLALRRQGAKAVPVWIASCLNPRNEAVGSLVITANGGEVVASDGFPNGPQAVARQAAEPRRTEVASVAAAGVTSQLEASDQAFLKSQVAQSPAAVPVVAVDASAPIAARSDAPAPRAAPKAKATATPAPRVLARRREASPEPAVEETVVETRVVTRAPAESYERRDRSEAWEAAEDDAPRKRLHIGRFFHRLFHGDE